MRVLTLLRQTVGTIPQGWRRLLLAVLLAAAASGSSVALMGTSAWLISRAAEMPPVLYLGPAATAVRAFGVSRSAFRYVERLMGHDVALRMQSSLRIQTYDRLSSTTLIGRRRGDLLTRLVTDVTAVMDLVVRVVIPVLSAGFVLVATSLILGSFNGPSALVLLVTALVAGVVVPVLAQRASRRADEAAVPARGRLADEIRQTTRTATDLLAYGAHHAALARMSAVDDELRRIEARTSWVRGIATAAQVVAAGIAVVAALWIGADAVAVGQLKPRLLAVLVLTPLALHEVFAAFTSAAQTFTRSRSAILRVCDVLDQPAYGRGDAIAETELTPGLRLREVTVGWPGEQPVASGITFTVRPGERVALVGPSGSGKTTIAATIMGAITPVSGQVERGGSVGYLAQDAHIFSTTVAENVRIGNKDATDSQVADALRRAGLDMPLGQEIREAGSTLSGGERRRLALARVLVDQRDVVILDEPTEHLDHATASALVRDLWDATRDAAVLVLTHDPAVMRDCHHIIQLGSPSQV